MYVLEELCSGMSDNAVGHEFKVHESTVYVKYDVFQQNTYKTRLVDKNVILRVLQDPNPVFPLGAMV